MKFRKHIFICINERKGSKRKSCGEDHGMKLVKKFKKSLLQHNQKKTEVRAQAASCLDACEFGPAVVVYPDGVFYGGVKPKHVDEIVEKHIIGGEVVERLVIDFSKK